MNGKFDQIIGPDGRDGYEYNWDALENGLVTQAIKKSKSFLPSKVQIQQIRKEAAVECLEKDLLNGTERCHPDRGDICLFNLNNDPCEMENLADLYEDIKNELLERLAKHNDTLVPPRNQPRDPASNPK